MEQKVLKQKQFFMDGKTRSFSSRLHLLKKLKQVMLEQEPKLYAAMELDLHKSKLEVYATELLPCLEELDYMIHHSQKKLRPKRKRMSLAGLPGFGTCTFQPYGTVLILAPWNYPFQLAMMPLIGAIACGNTAIIKPSEYAPQTAALIAMMVEQVFAMEHACVIQGDAEVSKELLAIPFDLIFFTGSTKVGQQVMEAASKHLTPVILELGGKSPCIVSETADLAYAAKRIVWGKFLNAGQTCVASDHVYVQEQVKEAFLKEIKKVVSQLCRQDETGVILDLCSIISSRHLARLEAMVDPQKVVCGGSVNHVRRQMAITVLTNVTMEDACMQEEIFGPLLPVLSYASFDQLTATLQKQPRPLALYYFGSSKHEIAAVQSRISFGSGCINDVILQVAQQNLPFGGIGASGMGRYHGYASIQAFTYEQSMLMKKPFFDLPLLYPPYHNRHNTVKKLMRFIGKERR